MSYARFGTGSDVYVYADVAGGVTCCCCILTPESLNRADFRCATAKEMAAHLREHIVGGHKVPEGAVMAVLGDAAFIEFGERG